MIHSSGLVLSSILIHSPFVVLSLQLIHCVYNSLHYVGSFVVHGALCAHDSLFYCGALLPPDSFLGCGTLLPFDSIVAKTARLRFLLGPRCYLSCIEKEHKISIREPAAFNPVQHILHRLFEIKAPQILHVCNPAWQLINLHKMHQRLILWKSAFLIGRSEFFEQPATT